MEALRDLEGARARADSAGMTEYLAWLSFDLGQVYERLGRSG